MRDHSTPSSSLSREHSLPRKESTGRSWAQAHSPQTCGWPFPHRQPRRRVDLKRPDRPAASAPPSRSWPSGRDEESFFRHAKRRDQTAKAYLSASNMLSSLRSVIPTPQGSMCRKSPPASLFFGLAVGGRIGPSPSTIHPFAASGPRDRRHTQFSPTSYGGGRHLSQTFSTPQVRYVFLSTTLCFLYRISFTNRSIYQGHRFGFSAQFGPATHFSLGEIPPSRFDGVQLTVVSSASNASVLQQELSFLLLIGAIEEVPQLDIEQGFLSRYFLVPKRDGVQDVDVEDYHVPDSGRGLVRHYRPEGGLFSHPGHPAAHEVPSVCLWRESLPIQGPSLWPGLGAEDIHEVHWCCAGPFSTEVVLKKYQVPGTVPSGKPPKSEPYWTVPCRTMQWKSAIWVLVFEPCNRPS